MQEWAASGAACRYHAAGFAAAIDLCQHLVHINQVVKNHPTESKAFKVLLLLT